MHVSPDLPVTLEWLHHLEPEIEDADTELRYVNDAVVIDGEGFLLGGDEGHVEGIFTGCYYVDDRGPCLAVDARVAARAGATRERVEIPLTPDAVGILPGRFDGELRLVNVHADGEERDADPVVVVDATLRPPEVDALTPTGASLGQWVEVTGGGFVGPTDADPSAITLLDLDGVFRVDGGPPIDVRFTLIPEMLDGRTLRYVVNESDDLGRAVDLRSRQGRFDGTATPVTFFGRDEVSGAPQAVSLELLPVRQVVWLKFLPSYVESLYHFGLRGADAQVRARIIDVVRRDYAGVNLDVRTEEPADFALYSVVEISGPDPNGLGLLGYDNTPGKDVGNLRLYDAIGGVNALTQQDGYPGYGGVFIESLFAYSKHPGRFAASTDADRRFDKLFDPFRPDREGAPVVVSEAEGADTDLGNDACPADGRKARVDCAIFTLGNLIGTTVSHEIAHSLGLADPDGEDFHNTGDWIDALMDGGSYRPFAERAEIDGQGPGQFCQSNYDYLREILPTDLEDPLGGREDCY